MERGVNLNEAALAGLAETIDRSPEPARTERSNPVLTPPNDLTVASKALSPIPTVTLRPSGSDKNTSGAASERSLLKMKGRESRRHFPGRRSK